MNVNNMSLIVVRLCRNIRLQIGPKYHYQTISLYRPQLIQLRHFATENKDVEPEKKLSLFQRFKEMYKNYWYVLIPVHIATSAVWLSTFYYLAKSGIDIPTLLESLQLSEKMVNSMRNSSMGYVAITYGLYKVSTPLRYTVTLGGTTISINYLRKWGYIKPIPSPDRLKEIYRETKDDIKHKKDNIMETMHNVQQSVKDTTDGIKERKDSIVSSVEKSKDTINRMKHKVIGQKKK